MPAYNYDAIRKNADPAVVSTLISTGRQRGLDDDHILAALATGIVESGLRNLGHGHGSSVGWRQEVAKYYGSAENRMNVAAATGRFYDELTKTPRKGSIGGWAQAVQRSAHPGRYDEALDAARGFLRDFGGTTQGGQARGGESSAPAQPGVWDADAFAKSMLDPETGEMRGESFDPRRMVTTLLQSTSEAIRSRALQGQSTTPGGELEQELADPGDEDDLTAEELLVALQGGEQVPTDAVSGDAEAMVDSLLAPGRERVDQARRAEAQARAQAQGQQPEMAAAAPGGAATQEAWGPPSNAAIPAKGLKPNALRGAQIARQLGFAGPIGGVGHRSNKSDHPHGNALDLMTGKDMALGQRIADHYVAQAADLGVKYVIFNQRIASPASNWQWRPMADRGSPTANHKDHPHISFY